MTQCRKLNTFNQLYLRMITLNTNCLFAKVLTDFVNDTFMNRASEIVPCAMRFWTARALILSVRLSDRLTGCGPTDL